MSNAEDQTMNKLDWPISFRQESYNGLVATWQPGPEGETSITISDNGSICAVFEYKDPFTVEQAGQMTAWLYKRMREYAPITT